MKLKAHFTAMVACAAFFSVCAYDCQMAINSIGDGTIVGVGGFTFAKPISIDLAPTNAPVSDAAYTIRCQIVYTDEVNDRPDTLEKLSVARMTGAILNEWLVEFVEEEYVGAEFSALVEEYYQKNLTDDLNREFQKFVSEKISAMDSVDRLAVNAVAVTVEAEGDLRTALLGRHGIDVGVQPEE